MPNPATEFVRAAREHSPVHEYVADRGEPVDRSAIEYVKIAGHPVAVPKGLTEEERGLVAGAIQATEQVTTACYANSFAMWGYDSWFKCCVDLMEILLSHESVKQVWDARDRALFRAREHVVLTGPGA